MKADDFDRRHLGAFILRTNREHSRRAVAAIVWRRDQDESNVHRHEGEEPGNVVRFKRRRA